MDERHFIGTKKCSESKSRALDLEDICWILDTGYWSRDSLVR
jgi:hypothetical protein